MVITWQTVITFAAVIGAIGVIAKSYNKGYDFIKKQNEQDGEIKQIKADIKSVKSEQQIITYGVLSCLKALSSQGADGPVHDAIDKIEKYLNAQAHS